MAGDIIVHSDQRVTIYRSGNLVGTVPLTELAIAGMISAGVLRLVT